MLKKFFARLLLGAWALAALTSCGSTSEGTANFATVRATASGPQTDLQADIVSSWTDANGTSVAACSTGGREHFLPTNVVYNITSTPYNPPDTGTSNATVASPLVVSQITMTFTPANTTSVALPRIYQTQYPTFGQTILPGTTTPITITVVSDEMKQFLANEIVLRDGSVGLACNPTISSQQYYVNVSFEMKEVNTGRVATVSAPGLFVDFADFGSGGQ